MAATFVDQFLQDPSHYSNFPAMLPPPGEQVNFMNPNSRGPIIIIFGAVLLGLMIMFVAARGYTKIYIIQKATWDDLTCTLAMVGAVFYYGLGVWSVHQGATGKHLWNVRMEQVMRERYLIQSLLTTILINPILICAKLTFFLLYLDLFRPMRWLRIASYIGAAFTILLYTSCMVAQLVLGIPRADESLLLRTSLAAQQQIRLAVPLSVLGLLLDLYIFVLPMSAVLKLQLPTARKLGVLLVFMTGLLACIASAVSTYYRVLLMRTDDHTWISAPIVLMAIMEVDVGVICACMPSMNQTIRHHVPSFNEFKSRYFSGSRFMSLRSSGGRSQRRRDRQSTKDNGESLAKHLHQYSPSKPYVKLETFLSTESEPGVELSQKPQMLSYAWSERTPVL